MFWGHKVQFLPALINGSLLEAHEALEGWEAWDAWEAWEAWEELEAWEAWEGLETSDPRNIRCLLLQCASLDTRQRDQDVYNKAADKHRRFASLVCCVWA